MDIQEGLNMQQYDDIGDVSLSLRGSTINWSIILRDFISRKKKHLNFKQKIRMIKPLMDEEITSRTKWRVR